MAHTELDLHERRIIEDMLNAKFSISKIAAELGRHRSTVYRDIKRNFYTDGELPNLSGYYGVIAQRKAEARRARRRKLIRIPKLRKGFHHIHQLTHEVIGAAIIVAKQNGNPLLMRVEDAAGQDNAFGTHMDAPVRHLVDIYVFADQATRQIIDLQPNALAVILQRQVFGDIAFVAQAEDFHEAIRLDVQSTMQVVRLGGSLCKLRVVAFSEAHEERVAVLFRNNDRSSNHFMRKLMDVMEPLPLPARKSITFDRGFEFREWRKQAAHQHDLGWPLRQHVRIGSGPDG